jgi:hypothetical protein
MVSIGGRLAIIQDDAHFVALVDVNHRTVEPISLPTGHSGQRQFDDLLGNKHWKLDLEACTRIVESGKEALLIFGSGSSPQREQILIVGWPPSTPEKNILHFHAPQFYSTLRSESDFSGSELNVEGAILLGDDCLRLFQRGNGAIRHGRPPLDSTCDISWKLLRQHLDDCRATPPPRPQNVVQYELGMVEETRLTFTDGAVRNGEVYFTATAEASPDVTGDGPVAGSALGHIDQDGTVRWALLENADGTPLRAKVEGLSLEMLDDKRAWILIDQDNPQVASELCEVELLGEWSR